MHRPQTSFTSALAALALVLAACKSGIREERFDAVDARMLEAIELASHEKEAMAQSAAPGTVDAHLRAWDELLRALLLARAAGALAYLADDEQSLADLEQRLAELLALMPAPVPDRPGS